MLLTNAKAGEKFVITKLHDGNAKKRLLDFGFCRGTSLKVLSIAPLGKTVLVSLRSYSLALRKNATALIEVERVLP